MYVCIFIIHNKYKLCTYIHVCAPRVQYIVVKVGCRGVYIAQDKIDVNLLHRGKYHYTHLCFKVGSCFDQLLNYFNLTSRTSNYQSCFTILVFSVCVCLIVYVSRASTKRLLPVVLTRYGRKLTQARLNYCTNCK